MFTVLITIAVPHAAPCTSAGGRGATSDRRNRGLRGTAHRPARATIGARGARASARPCPLKRNNAMPAQTSPPPGTARPLPPPSANGSARPARRGQTTPPHTAHPDQRHPHCPDRRGARPDRAGDLHRAERAGREAQLPGRPGAAVGRGRPAAGRHRRDLADAAAGTARITQLRRAIHRTRRGQPPAPATPGKKEQRPC
jgi:hypothetical protein